VRPGPTSLQPTISQGQPLGPPHALSHEAAIQSARNNTQPTANIPSSTGPSIGHPGISRAEPHPGAAVTSRSPSTSRPLQSSAQQAPVPVQMPAARPSLNGGQCASGAGPQGQPALQRHPGFVLEGEGERVLSEKKLEELVRQVTGSGGGEGAEMLEPDVKEV